MKLYENWREILRKAWSMRFIALASVSNGAVLVLALVPELLPRTWSIVLALGVATAVFNLLAGWSRLVSQKGV